MVDFNNNSRSKTKEGDQKKKKKKRKRNTFDSISAFHEAWKITVNASKSEIFPIKGKYKGLKILTSEDLLNEIRKMIHSSHWEK